MPSNKPSIKDAAHTSLSLRTIYGASEVPVPGVTDHSTVHHRLRSLRPSAPQNYKRVETLGVQFPANHIRSLKGEEHVQRDLSNNQF